MAEPTYDPAKRYEIKLSRPVKYRGMTLKPLADKITLSGQALNDIVAEHGEDVVDLAAPLS